MIERIASPHAVAHVDLARGGTIAHFGSSDDARDNLLARVDSSASAPADSSEFSASRREWLTPYCGGWQVLTPNAGDECLVGETFHPFHGDVSRHAWSVVERSAAFLKIRTAANNAIAVTRTMTLNRDCPSLVVSTTIENRSSERAPAILVEHIALAGGDDARVHAPARSHWESPPAARDRLPASPWSEALARPIPVGTSRVVSLVEGSEGWIELRRSRLSVRIDWDPDELPYLWYWQERGTPGFPFHGHADIIGLEPASAAFADGLARAIERGEAWWLDPNESRSTSLEISFTS